MGSVWVDKGAGFCAVSTSDYRMNGGFAPLNPPHKAVRFIKTWQKLQKIGNAPHLFSC